MGKGARSRANNAVSKAENRVKEAALTKKQKANKLAALITSLVLVIALAGGGIFYGVVYGSGKYLRDNIVMSTENFKVDNAMMTYFFKSTFRNVQSSYMAYFGDFESMTGVNTAKSLKGQDYQDGQTWFDYILDTTKASIDSLLVMAEAAKAEGLELSESDKLAIGKSVDALEGYHFQGGVKKEDARKSMEIAALAQKYSNKFQDEMVQSDGEIEKYYKENINTYRTAGYRSYELSYAQSETEGATPYTEDKAKAKAEELKAAKSEEAFVELVKGAIKDGNASVTDDEITTQAATTLHEKATFTADDEASTWAFDDARKVGDTYVKADEEGETFTAYFLTSTPVRDEEITYNIRHILLSTTIQETTEKAQLKAEEVKALFDANPTEENFAELALGYSDDQGSKNGGGKYAGIKKGDMPTEIEAWIGDNARKAGDAEIIKTESGSHIVYFAGKGRPFWQETISSDMTNAAFEAKTTELKTTYPVTVNEDKLTDIPA